MDTLLLAGPENGEGPSIVAGPGTGAINGEWQANGLGDADPGYYYQQTFNVKQRTAAGYLQADFTNYNNLRGNLAVSSY